MKAPGTASDLAALSADLLRQIADRQIRVHCLTNSVAEPITANALLAIGAVPSLTAESEELPDFLRGADALLINLGTPTAEKVAVRRLAAAIAGKAGMPWVLDPVMVDRADRRRREAESLMAERPTAIRCNEAEAATLAGGLTGLTGALVCTGALDRVRQGARVATLEVGHPMLARITATGCALSAILAAFLAVHPKDRMAASLAALAAFGAAGAEAADGVDGPGSLAVRLLDRLSTLTEDRIAARIGRYELRAEDSA
ncbi:MAG: hydroxyethylthiazole kinase [Alphaproteobacteria bacterium]|uniref:hydroxyethylthiazole kinase n=1 Tax=Pacificispira sp. TaxID=2888761 RepID=UPI0032F385AB